jgi:hypothetical protein
MINESARCFFSAVRALLKAFRPKSLSILTEARGHRAGKCARVQGFGRKTSDQAVISEIMRIGKVDLLQSFFSRSGMQICIAS